MQIFKRIASLFRRLHRGAGADVDAAQQAALAEAFASKRDAFIAFVGETSLTDDLKGRLTKTAAKCSRWDELQERIEHIIWYIHDLWDMGGEDFNETARVLQRVRELS